MSTGPKVRFGVAQASAHEVESLLRPVTRDFLTVGSVRRERDWIGDVEHVAIPMTENKVEMGEPDLFGKRAEIGRRVRNLLLERLDELVAQGTIQKATHEVVDKSNGEVQERECWGEKQRRFTIAISGCPSQGLIRHEIFLAERENWGPIVAIRTGPDDFSWMLVSRLNERGIYKQGGFSDKTRGYLCYASGATKGEIRPCPTEQEYLTLCGLPKFVPPANRDAWVEGGVRR